MTHIYVLLSKINTFLLLLRSWYLFCNLANIHVSVSSRHILFHMKLFRRKHDDITV